MIYSQQTQTSLQCPPIVGPLSVLCLDTGMVGYHYPPSFNKPEFDQETILATTTPFSYTQTIKSYHFCLQSVSWIHPLRFPSPTSKPKLLFSLTQIFVKGFLVLLPSQTLFKYTLFSRAPRSFTKHKSERLGCSSVAKHLPSALKALDSIPSTVKHTHKHKSANLTSPFELAQDFSMLLVKKDTSPSHTSQALELHHDLPHPWGTSHAVFFPFLKTASFPLPQASVPHFSSPFTWPALSHPWVLRSSHL